MISYNNSAPTAVNNVGQFGATEGSIGAYKSAAEYAADSKYWALLSQKNYDNIGGILKEVERLFTEGELLKDDIEALKLDFENQNQILMGLIQQTGEAVDNTNTAINNANAATDSANQAVQDVLTQLDKISNMSVVATTLPPGSPATGSFDNATGVFSFGIPEGLPGKDGKDGTDGTISDIGDVAIGTPVSDDYGFFVDKEDGGLYRTSMSEIANLVPAVVSFNGRTGQVFPATGDYTVAQVTGAAASGVNNDINQIRGLTTALSVAQGGTDAKSADDARTNLSAMLDSKVGLDGTINLNDLNGVKAGFYYQPASANAKPELNYPVQLAGSLVVVKTGADTEYSCKQVYNLYNNPNVTYSRILNAIAGPTSPWSEWRRHTAIDRVEEGTITTNLYSPGDAKLQVGTSGLWGCTNGNNWVPLGLAQGGTGSTTAAGARANLNLARFGAIGSETQVFSPNGSKKIIITDDKWGTYDTTAAKYLPLGVEQGGTGGGTADAARMSLVAAKSGDNSDITSMTNKVTFTQSPVIPDAMSRDEPVALGQLSTETASLETKINEAKDAAAAANTNADSRVPTAQLSDTSSVAQGDALVGVMAPFTGATARTQHDKNSDYLDLLDFGIDITGTLDMGSQLQALADTLHASNRTLTLRGTIRTTTNLNIRGAVIFEPGFKLVGVKTEAGPTTTVSFYSSNILVSGITLDGVILNFYPATSEVTPRNKRCIVFTNNTLDDSAVSIGSDALSVRNVLVQNNTFKNSGTRNATAIRLINVSNIDISYNLIQEYSRPIHNTATRSFSNYNINIHHNNMVCNYGIALEGTSAFRVSKINISDNDIVCENRNTSSGGYDGILVQYGTSVTISNNNVRTNGRCISCINSKVVIRDNYLVASAVSNFVVGLASCYESSFISNNVFQNTTAEVIAVHIFNDANSLYKSNNIRVELNTIKGFGRLIRILDTVDYEVVNNRLVRTSNNGNAVLVSDGTSDRGHIFGNAVVAFSGAVISSIGGSNNVTNSTDSLLVVPSFTKTITAIANGAVDAALNNSKSFIFSISISDVQQMRALSTTGSGNAKTVSQFMSSISGATLAWNGSAFLSEVGGSPDIYVNGILQDSYGSEDYAFFRSGMIIDTQNRLSVRDFQCVGDGDTLSDGAGNMTLRNVSAAQAAEGAIHSAFFRSPLVMDGLIYNPDNTGIYRKSDFDTVLDPRIAIGQRADGTYIVICVNGRNADGVSPGCTMQQLANKFIELNCINAMNLDGGGSATLWYNGSILNTPTDGSERPVYHCMYV